MASSVGASPNSMVVRGLGDANTVAWLCRNSYWDKLLLVYSWCCCLVVQERLLSYTGASL